MTVHSHISFFGNCQLTINSQFNFLFWLLIFSEQHLTKYHGKEKEQFFSFPQYYPQYISSFSCKITYSFIKCGSSIYFFLDSTNLIYRGSDISQFFRESLELRDNENRLYQPFWSHLPFHLHPRVSEMYSSMIETGWVQCWKQGIIKNRKQNCKKSRVWWDSSFQGAK